MSETQDWKDKLLLLKNKLDARGFKCELNEDEKSLYVSACNPKKPLILFMKIATKDNKYVADYITLETKFSNLYYHSKTLTLVENNYDKQPFITIPNQESFLVFDDNEVDKFIDDPAFFIFDKIIYKVAPPDIETWFITTMDLEEQYKDWNS